MPTYAEVKTKLKRNKDKIKTVVYCGLIFLLGFGTGKGTAVVQTPKAQQANYTTKSGAKPAQVESTKQNAPVDLTHCIVKGNISSKGKIYHVRGGASYKTVKPEQCFDTETEARAAGFKKASR
jgi:hypothetical protein